MSTSLPQEVQTSKVATLPDDLKAIAEKMLKDKFGVKESSVKEDTFRQEYQPFGASVGPSYVHHGLGREGLDMRAGFDFPNKQRVFSISIARADSRIFHDAVNILMGETRCRRGDITLFAPKQFLRHMLSDPEAQHFFREDYRPGHGRMIVGQMFGVKIALIDEGIRPTLEARF